MILAVPALAEAYAVLTRLPAPHRLAADDAQQVLQVSFVEQGKLVALDGTRFLRLLDQAPERGITGGAFYDAVIAACALKGRAATCADPLRPSAQVKAPLLPAARPSTNRMRRELSR